MAVSVNYYESEPQGGYTDASLVAYSPEENSVWPGIPRGNPLVQAFLAGGGSIGPYTAPSPAPTVDEMDAQALNEALTQPGTVTRAMGELLFGVIKGTIPVTPSLTKAQFVAQLKAKMRNGQ